MAQPRSPRATETAAERCSLEVPLHGGNARAIHGILYVQAAQFEAVLKEEIAASPAMPLWYPGARDLHARFVKEHPGCDLITPTATPGEEFGAPPPTSRAPWACSDGVPLGAVPLASHRCAVAARRRLRS